MCIAIAGPCLKVRILEDILPGLGKKLEDGQSVAANFKLSSARRRVAHAVKIRGSFHALRAHRRLVSESNRG